MEPIKENEYITESDYWDHWFTREIADYVNECTNRDSDIKWLSDCYEDKGVTFDSDENGKYFIVTSREEYFADKFIKFKGFLANVAECSLEEFSKGLRDMWFVKDAYEERFAFYVDADGEVMTFDSFVRGCAVNEKYYIGGTMDYHW
jgi:hypothetical protein